MAKFPRRGASVSKTRTAAIVTACVVLAVFALSSRPDWVHTAAQTSQRPEGRSLRATGSTSASSTTSFFRQSAPQAPVSHSIGDDVLVLYLYDNRDPVWVENFNFFLQWGIKYNDGCSYIILVSEAMYAEKVHIGPLDILLLDQLACCVWRPSHMYHAGGATKLRNSTFQCPVSSRQHHKLCAWVRHAQSSLQLKHCKGSQFQELHIHEQLRQRALCASICHGTQSSSPSNASCAALQHAFQHCVQLCCALLS